MTQDKEPLNSVPRITSTKVHKLPDALVYDENAFKTECGAAVPSRLERKCSRLWHHVTCKKYLAKKPRKKVR